MVYGKNVKEMHKASHQAPHAPPIEGLATPAQMTKILICSTDDLCRWRNNGMPYKKIGGFCYYNVDDVHAWFRGDYVKGGEDSVKQEI